jgi:glycosyltransferase involved in cell wall biosynthesis
LNARWPRTQICNSVSALNEIRQAGKVFAPKYPFVVCNGIDFEGFPTLPVPQLGPPVILGIGSLLPVKRWDRLIEAARMLKTQGFEFVVRIVGDGPLRPKLAEFIRELGVSDCVQLTGNCDDVSRMLEEAQFLVHTSDSEGCPNVVMEAMACGRTVVATEVGDVPLLLDDDTIGFVVPCDDPSLLTTRMVTLLSQPQLCQHMGVAARMKAKQLFSLDRLVSETLAVYRAAGWKDN